MRSALCSLILAVCFVVCNCTANASEVDLNGQKNLNGNTGAVVTATTTTAAPTPPIQARQPLNTATQEDDQAKTDEEDTTQKRTAQDDGHAQVQKLADSSLPEKGEDEPAKRGGQQSEEQDVQVNVVGQQVATKTTTTTVNVNSVQIADGSHGEQTKTTEGQQHIQERDASLPLPDVVDPSTGQLKTTTTTSDVQIPSGSQKDKMKEQSTPSKHGGVPDIKVTDTAEAATTTTTNVPTKTLPKQFNIPQSVNNKDSSSSTSLLLVFAIIAMLAVIPVAPVW